MTETSEVKMGVELHLGGTDTPPSPLAPPSLPLPPVCMEEVTAVEAPPAHTTESCCCEEDDDDDDDDDEVVDEETRHKLRTAKQEWREKKPEWKAELCELKKAVKKSKRALKLLKRMRKGKEDRHGKSDEDILAEMGRVSAEKRGLKA
jgi:hypothetical protein